MIEFFFPQSLRRLPYLIRSLVIACLMGLLLPLHEASSPEFTDNYIAWLAAGVGLLTYQVIYIMRPRCKDAGVSLWFLALIFVPLIDGLFAIFLLFARSRHMRLG